MQDFETIRPYRDDEVPAVIRGLCGDPDLLRAAALFFAPHLAAWFPWLARRLTQRFIMMRTRHLDSVEDVQEWLAGYMKRVIRDTIAELSVDGLENLTPGQSYLFVSNHRDIVMDSGLISYVIHQAGHATVRSAVGDNLLSEPYAADLMRLNKSFVVERSVSGTKAVFKALSRTSAYIRHSLEEGVSVWIAQREGRAKDGFDRTDRALLKMLALAYRNESTRFGDLLQQVRLVPVSVSYELDPCDRRKAHELCVRKRFGSYTKPSNEDLQSMVDGIMGYKGRVHLKFSKPLTGDFEDAEAMARALDRAIVDGLRIFPTHLEAAKRLGMPVPEQRLAALPKVTTLFRGRIETCPAEELPFLLASYANLLRNRAELQLSSV
jgi:hypothetical protein